MFSDEYQTMYDDPEFLKMRINLLEQNLQEEKKKNQDKKNPSKPKKKPIDSISGILYAIIILSIILCLSFSTSFQPFQSTPPTEPLNDIPSWFDVYAYDETGEIILIINLTDDGSFKLSYANDFDLLNIIIYSLNNQTIHYRDIRLTLASGDVLTTFIYPNFDYNLIINFNMTNIPVESFAIIIQQNIGIT